MVRSRAASGESSSVRTNGRIRSRKMFGFGGVCWAAQVGIQTIRAPVWMAISTDTGLSPPTGGLQVMPP